MGGGGGKKGKKSSAEDRFSKRCRLDFDYVKKNLKKRDSNKNDQIK